MRVAGALAAFSAGIDENVIRALGRWKSNDAMMRYLRGLPVVKAASASRTMAQALQIAEGAGTSNFRRISEMGQVTSAPVGLWTLEEVNSRLLIRHGITGAVHTYRRPAVQLESLVRLEVGTGRSGRNVPGERRKRPVP